jgi:transcriptional regulator with XRE-family HTH domain
MLNFINIYGFMWNGQIINVLLKERKLKAKDLLEYLQLQTNGSITSLVRGNPTAERIEKIADFFDVPIDALFQRNKSYGYNVVGNSNQVANITIGELRSSLERIIDEKDKRIAILEDMVELLKKQQNP